MKILAFAASSSKNSINKKLVGFAASYFVGNEIEILDLNDYEMPIFSVDRAEENGIPQPAIQFAGKIDLSDLIIISFAEHNGAYTAAFKNIFDWLSWIPNQTVWRNKPMFLLATSTGQRGGLSVLEMAKNRFPRHEGNVVETFSLPNFNDNFDMEKGITTKSYLLDFEQKIERIKHNYD